MLNDKAKEVEVGADDHDAFLASLEMEFPQLDSSLIHAIVSDHSINEPGERVAIRGNLLQLSEAAQDWAEEYPETLPDEKASQKEEIIPTKSTIGNVDKKSSSSKKFSSPWSPFGNVDYESAEMPLKQNLEPVANPENSLTANNDNQQPTEEQKVEELHLIFHEQSIEHLQRTLRDCNGNVNGALDVLINEVFLATDADAQSASIASSSSKAGKKHRRQRGKKRNSNTNSSSESLAETPTIIPQYKPVQLEDEEGWTRAPLPSQSRVVNRVRLLRQVAMPLLRKRALTKPLITLVSAAPTLCTTLRRL